MIQGSFLGNRLQIPVRLPHSGAVQLSIRGPATQLPPTLLNLRPRGIGQRLPEAVQQKMETLFKADFSDVRVHVGHEASSIGALAFTQGSDIYFAHGQYNPNLSHGQRLIGHELTHVLQQKAGRVRNPFGTGLAVVQDSALEAEAERMGLRVQSMLPCLHQPSPSNQGLITKQPSLQAILPKATPKTVQCAWAYVDPSDKSRCYHVAKNGTVDTSNVYIYRTKKGASGVWQKDGTSEYYVENRDVLYRTRAFERRSDEDKASFKPANYNAAKPFDVRTRGRANSQDDLIVATTASPIKIATEHKVTSSLVSPNTYKTQSTPVNKIRAYTRGGPRPYSLFTTSSPRTPLKGGNKTRSTTLKAWPNNRKSVTVYITRSTQAGNRKPSQNAVMGGSALSHAIEADYKNADQQRWEWLHLIARSLGGKNVIENLVAGAFDRNTEMIPFEETVLKRQGQLKPKERIQYTVTADLIPGTHIAKNIYMEATIVSPAKAGTSIAKKTINATNNLKITRLQLDLESRDLGLELQ